jgi:50S ribosomal protein L16 3-hydroxylase
MVVMYPRVLVAAFLCTFSFGDCFSSVPCAQPSRLSPRVRWQANKDSFTGCGTKAGVLPKRGSLFLRRGNRCHGVRSSQASLPLEIKECKLFKEDGSYDATEANAFLKAYWQKQPVLIRQAFPFESPISPDELAGLSLEEDVASRLIINWGALDAASRPPEKKDYELRVGPFTDESFTRDVPETCYTLLCNEVCSYVPELADLQARFRFIPNWRLDDIMISYAATGGGVGPHVDNYDVFLLQGRGRRKWAVSTTPIPAAAEEIVDGIDVRVLKGGFHKDAEWVLEPGDILYCPPRFPHWGVSMDDECMTYSIGFRAPNLQDIASEFANSMCDSRNPDDFYTDPPSFAVQPSDAGRIEASAVERMWTDVAATMLGSARAGELPAPPHFKRWLGGFLTQRLQRAAGEDGGRRTCDAEEAAGILAEVEEGVEELCLTRNEASKVAWLELDDAGVAVSADGRVWEFAASGQELAALQKSAAVLCGSHVLFAGELRPLLTCPEVRCMVQEWVEEGVLYCAIDEDELLEEASSYS